MLLFGLIKILLSFLCFLRGESPDGSEEFDDLSGACECRLYFQIISLAPKQLGQ